MHLHLEHVSVQSSHIASVQWLLVASGYITLGSAEQVRSRCLANIYEIEVL